MDAHEKSIRCLHPSCSKRDGFADATGLKRHQKQTHEMHGGAEYFYCPHAGCSRAEGGRRRFPRKENLEGHLKRLHNEQDTVSGKANRPIAARTGTKRKRNEAEASDETARLRTTT